jgi:hypothetical protein
MKGKDVGKLQTNQQKTYRVYIEEEVQNCGCKTILYT